MKTTGGASKRCIKPALVYVCQVAPTRGHRMVPSPRCLRVNLIPAAQIVEVLIAAVRVLTPQIVSKR